MVAITRWREALAQTPVRPTGSPLLACIMVLTLHSTLTSEKLASSQKPKPSAGLATQDKTVRWATSYIPVRLPFPPGPYATKAIAYNHTVKRTMSFRFSDGRLKITTYRDYYLRDAAGSRLCRAEVLDPNNKAIARATTVSNVEKGFDFYFDEWRKTINLSPNIRQRLPERLSSTLPRREYKGRRCVVVELDGIATGFGQVYVDEETGAVLYMKRESENGSESEVWETEKFTTLLNGAPARSFEVPTGYAIRDRRH
jgi:hypothetical protein